MYGIKRAGWGSLVGDLLADDGVWGWVGGCGWLGKVIVFWEGSLMLMKAATVWTGPLCWAWSRK